MMAVYLFQGVTQVALVLKNSPANAGDLKDLKSIPGWGRSPAGGSSATHSSILAWRIPWTEEPKGFLYINSWPLCGLCTIIT